MKDYYPEGFLLCEAENKKNLSSIGLITQAMQNKTILEAEVLLCDASHNLIVNLGCIKGIIPRNEGAIGIAEGITRDIALISRVGRAVSFVVEDIVTDGLGESCAILSRKKAQEMCLDYMKENIRAGDIIDVKITHLENFGAFCDVGCGNIALLPIDSISVSRISHPKDRFSVGDTIKAVVSAIGEEGRITLSHKELLGTWEENCAFYSQGETVSGVVRSIEPYGIFVELRPNLAGLAEPKEGVAVGDTAGVYIKSIIPEKMKIKLIIIDSFKGNSKITGDYFYEGEHIDSFIYSPESSGKRIETIFN